MIAEADNQPTAQPLHPEEIRCPRCGYDQRGVMAAWIDLCPIEGTCSECGLVFRWWDVLYPERHEPLWCVEFARPFRRFPRSTIATLFRSFWPWRFWARLNMAHPIRWGRLVLYLLTIIMLLLLTYVPAQAGVAWWVRYRMQQTVAQQHASMLIRISSLQSLIASAANGPTIADGLTDQQRRMNLASYQSQMAALQRMTKSPPVINISYTEAVFEGVLFPTASTSMGSVVYPGAASPYIAPEMLWNVALNSGMGGWTASGPVWTGATRTCVRWLAYGTVMLVLLPASLVLLPVSRRKAKVRWSHIGRVLMYSTFIPASVVAICLATLAFGIAFGGPTADYQNWMVLITCFAPPLMLICWWGAAINRYLKIGHGHFTAFMLMVVCTLIVAIAIWWIEPRILIRGW